MVAAIMTFPGLVTGGIEKAETLNADQVMEQLDQPQNQTEDPAAALENAAKDGQAEKEDDAMKALMEAAEQDSKKKP